MGTATRPAKTSPGPWDAFADVDVFVDEVLAELVALAKAGTRPMRSGPKPPLAGAALRKAIMAIWCVCFCGMQWRAIGRLCDIPFGTLYGLFARWTRLGLWRRLLDRLRRTWRLACGDAPEPSAVVIDSRSCRSTPSCFDRGIDGGKKTRGIKLHVAVDKYGIPLAIDVSPSTPSVLDKSCGDPSLAMRGTASVIPTNPSHKHKWPINLETYKQRNVIERMFSRLKDFRRIATRYDKLARNFASAIALAAVIVWWAD
jgi:transposase